MERLFATDKPGNPGYSGSDDPTDPDGYNMLVKELIEDSRDYERSYLALDRNQATAYYYGLLPNINGTDVQPYSDQTIVAEPNATYGDVTNPDDNPNRSTYVSTDVRDAIKGILPSLIRIFGASENVISLVPRTQEDIETAEQGTDYVNYVFWHDNDGFLILHGAFKDAMTVKTGFVKWWTDDHPEKQQKTFQHITMEQLQVIASEAQEAGQDIRVIDKGDVAPDGTIDFITLEFSVSKPKIRVMGVPPEEIRLDPNARSFSTSRIVGHERVVPIDDLTAMGYEREQCEQYAQTSDTNDNFTQESQMRNPARTTSRIVGKGVNYGEWYIRIDKDGDGHAELRKICTMGNAWEIVADEPANRVKIACFSCDPVSHTIVGDSVADDVIDIQRLKTNMWRGILDSLAESINPKTSVNELVVDMDDVMNDDLGAIIRVRGDPNSAVAYTTVPFAGQQAVPVLDLIDGALQRRTGQSDASKGLDAKALQSSTQLGVDAIISGAQERIELIARVLAETGFKDLFSGLYNEVCENPNQRRTLRIRGKFKDFDTSLFDSSMGVEVNPTLGKGTDTVRMMTLQQIKADQQALVAQMGINNPICGITEMLNTVTDILELNNFKNVGRYFKTPTPQEMQAILSAPKEPDPLTVAAKAQFEKVKLDASAKVNQSDFNQQKLASDDAFRRDQLAQQKELEEQQQALELHRQQDEAALKAKQIEVAREVGLAKAASKPAGEG